MADPYIDPDEAETQDSDPVAAPHPLHDRLEVIDSESVKPSRMSAWKADAWTVLERLLNRPVTPWLGLVLALLLLTPCLYAGLSCDDYVIRWIALGYPGIEALSDESPYDTFRFATGDVQRNLIYQDHGLMPWYANPEVKIAFARGLASLSHYIDFKYFDTWALPMYLQNIFWYGAACAVLIIFYRRVVPVAWVGTLAALLYIFDDSHAMPVGWISNRNGLMALFFVALVLLFHDKWRRDEKPRYAVFAMLSFAIGMLCGEATVAACAYVFGYALCLDKRGPVRGILAIVPYGVILLCWAIPYKMLDYGTFGSGFYQDPVNETLQYLSVIPGRIPLLVNSLFSRPFARIAFWGSQLQIAVLFCIVTVLLTITVYVLWPLIRRNAVARFFAIGMALSLIPASATMAHDRNLLYASIGAMGIMALFFGGMVEKASWLPKSPVWNRVAGYAVIFWVFIHVMASPYAMPAESLHMSGIGDSQQETIVGLPPGFTSKEKDWVTINLPSDLDAWYLNGILHAGGHELPRRMWHLTTGPFEADLTRTGPNSFTIKPDGGYLISPWGRFFTSFDYEMVPGYTVELSGMTATVLRIMHDGRPKEVEFTFDRSLDDPSLQFMTYHAFQFKPFDLPPVGESVELPAGWMNAPKSEWESYKRERAAESEDAPTYSVKDTSAPKDSEE